MWNLIKMDFYRLFTSKTMKVGAIMALLVSAGYMLGSLGIVELCRYVAANDTDAALGLSFVIPQAGWIFGIDFADIVLSGTAAFSLFIGCMISANFIGSEQSCGYTKNFAGQLTDKGNMAISKFIVTSASQFVILFIYSAVSAILAEVLFGKYISGHNIRDLLLALFLRLLLYFAINAIIVFLCTLTKSHAIAMVAGCIFGIGVTQFAYPTIEVVLSVLKINFPISSYMPDGINSQLSIDSARSLTVNAIAVSIIFVAVFLGANYFVQRRRDVR